MEAFTGTAVYGILSVIVLAVASVTGLVFFVNKEEKFEDVVAAQKKEQEALLSSLQGTGKSAKGNKKWSKLKSKKASKKSGENDDEPEIDSGLDEEETTPEPTPQQQKPIINQSRKETKRQKAKDKEIEQKVLEKEENLKSGKDKSKKNKKTKQVVEENIISVEEESTEQAEPPAVDVVDVVPKKQEQVKSLHVQKDVINEQSKKGKSGKGKQEKPTGTSRNIVSSIKLTSDIEEANLNPNEVQQLIDVLLAKQNENEQWKKPNQKGDPLEILRKQLSDMDVELTEERKLAQSAALRNKELKTELNQERVQKQNLQQVASKLAKQSKEHEAARKHAEETHLSEIQSAKAQITRMQQLIDGASQRELQQLSEENKHLKSNSMRAQKVAEENKKLINELNQLQQANQSMHKEYDSTMKQNDQQQKSLQDKISAMEDELQSAHKIKNESEQAMSKNLNDLKTKLTNVEEQNKLLSKEVDQLKQDEQKAKAEVETLQKSSPSEDEVSKLSTKLLDMEAELSRNQSSVKELLAQVDQKNCELKTQQETNKSLQENLDNLQSTTTQKDELTKIEKLLKNKEQEIADLKKGNESNSLDNAKLKDLEKALEESKAEQENLSQTIDTMKKKNNDLREKNWKAMDALGKAEDDAKKNEKSLEKLLFKSLKNLHPDLKLPKNNDGLEDFFQQYEQVYKKHCSESDKVRAEELESLRKENEELKKEVSAFEDNTPKFNMDEDEIEKMKLENANLKNVLGETESMLSRLQAGVDAEVAKWQSKVASKDTELEEIKSKFKELEEVSKAAMDKSAQENASKQKELQEKLDATTKQLNETKDSSTSEVADVNAKLKKTISERDLLIREYKSIKDKHEKLESSVKKSQDEADGEVKKAIEAHQKETKKLQDQITALENTAKSSGKGDKEKDKLIKELYLEIEELKEDLREERDRVIVDIETPESETLHKKVDELTNELQQEKEAKFNLSIKLDDLEKSFQEEQSDKDKIMNLESKLKAAEAKISDLETARTTQITNEIEDAMKQYKQQLSVYERDLEHEKKVNKLLAEKLASASGTTV